MPRIQSLNRRPTIPIARTIQIGPMVSTACLQNRHQECTANCTPLLPFPCGCTCHEKKPLTT
jgi:hypothetical protein